METPIKEAIRSIKELQPPQEADGLPKNNFEDVELTPEEAQEALREGRKRKWHQLQHNQAVILSKEYWENLKRPQEYPIMSASMYSDFVIKKSPSIIEGGYKIDDSCSRIFELLCYYFTNDERFCDGTGYSLRKGLALFGGVGVGKTDTMRIFSVNPGQSYFVVNCQKIAELYSNWNTKEDPECPVDRFYGTDKVAVNDNYFGHKTRGFCFDDLGTESIPTKNYGRDRNVMADIFLQRYANKLPFNTCHLTTNIESDEIEKYYGSRVANRFDEMFNILEYPKSAPSRR